MDAREEAIIATGLLLAAFAISLRYDAYLSDTRLWIVLLIVQSTPYLAAVFLSLVSAFEQLPTRLFNGNRKESLLEHLNESLAKTER